MRAAAANFWTYQVAASIGAADELMNKAEQNAKDDGANLPRRRRVLSPSDYVAGVLAGDRGVLARTITLVESTSPMHEAQAQEVLQRLLPHTGHSQRIGITGVP